MQLPCQAFGGCFMRVFVNDAQATDCFCLPRHAQLTKTVSSVDLRSLGQALKVPLPGVYLAERTTRR
jgi:hypothetical protein